MRKSTHVSSPHDTGERFIQHLLQEISKLHEIIAMLTPKVTARPVNLADALGGSKAELFLEDQVQVQQFYKELGIKPDGSLSA